MTTQAYFWTPAWQRGEREADADIVAGRTRRFATAHEAIAWLHQRRRGSAQKGVVTRRERGR